MTKPKKRLLVENKNIDRNISYKKKKLKNICNNTTDFIMNICV